MSEKIYIHDHEDTANAMGNMGAVLFNQNKLDEAETFYR